MLGRETGCDKAELFDGSGDVVEERTRTLLNGWIDRFAEWIERTGPGSCRESAHVGGLCGA